MKISFTKISNWSIPHVWVGCAAILMRKTGSVQSNPRYKHQWRADFAHFLYEGSIMPLFRILIVVRVQIEIKIDFLDLIWYTQKRFYPLIYRLLHHFTHHQWLFVIQKTKYGGVKNWKGGKKLFQFETCIIKTALNVNKQHSLRWYDLNSELSAGGQQKFNIGFSLDPTSYFKLPAYWTQTNLDFHRIYE